MVWTVQGYVTRHYLARAVRADGLGTFPMLLFVALISFCSIIFVGGSSSPGPKGTYSVPEAGGIWSVKS